MKKIICSIVSILLAATFFTFANPQPSFSIDAATFQLHKKVLSLKGAVAVGKGRNGRLFVAVEKDTDMFAVAKAYPDAIIVRSRMPRALQARTDKWRPAPGGVSIGHYAITAGTLGALTPDGMILSNNHVLANSNDAEIGDPILQPGPYDGGTVANDQIGTLYKFVPIQFITDNPGDCPIQQAFVSAINYILDLLGSSSRIKGFSLDTPINEVDCALCKPRAPPAEYVLDSILDIGDFIWQPNVTYQVGQIVKKSGRTTGLQISTIEAIEASVNVSYGSNKIAFFTNQIILDNPNAGFIAGGDSGSALLDESDRMIGLCFAGSDTLGIANDINSVRRNLNF
jgi:hypothetical protein